VSVDLANRELDVPSTATVTAAAQPRAEGEQTPAA
jgi:hypothetical protein